MNIVKCSLWIVIVTLLVTGLPCNSIAGTTTRESSSLVRQVLRLYDTESPPDPGTSGTMLLRQLRREFESLDTDDRARVIHLLEEPVTTGPRAPSSQRHYQTEHFDVYYHESGTDAVPAGDSNGSGIPDYVEQLASYLEHSWAVQVVELGFAPPPTTETPGERISVHLRHLNHNGLTHAATGRKPWLEINSDIEAFTRRVLGDGADTVVTDPEGLRAGMLKACAAHEFFHCIQAGYDWDEAHWWCEGTAEWMGHRVFPESNFYAHNVKARFTSPHTSLFAEESWAYYAASVFVTFLAENYGGDELIRRLWEGCRGDATIIDSLKHNLGDLYEVYEFFSCYVYLREFPNGTRYPAPSTTTLQVPGTLQPAERLPEYFGANFIEIPVANRPSINLSVNLEGEGSVRLVTLSGTHWSILPITSSPNGELAEEIPTQDIDTVTVIIIGFQESSPLRYTIDVR